MLALSQTCGYAILALACLDPEARSMTLEREIAGQTGIAKPYLSKLLHKLAKAGLIVSKRGYKGGVALAAPAAEISMLDVADAVDGDGWRTKCFLGLPNCSSDQPCPMHEFWLKTRPRIEKTLVSLTLDKVGQFREQGWRL